MQLNNMLKTLRNNYDRETINYITAQARSFKTAIYGTFVRRMRKDVRYCFDKNHDERLESKLE